MPESSERVATALSDRYRLERELGQGGMATVYLAQDLKHDRKVAIKVLHPELSAVIGGERFLAEIKVTANLQHPHILPLFDSGSADGLLFYVMPYVQGESLRAKMSREKQLGVEEAVRLASQVASALDYAHRQGVVHRDIKPENVLLHDGVALVADFGIALAATNAGATRMTATGLSLGTPAYMSPEQAMGDREVDARSDVYSLATMLYEMLVGDPPHSGSTAQAIVAKVLTEKPVPVTVHRETVPVNVAAAIQKALHKLPADRFASAAEFAKALATPGWSSGESLATTAMPSVGAPSRRRRNAWPVIALGGALAAGALGWWLKPETPRPVRRFEVLTRGNYGAMALSPDGSAIAAVGAGPDTSGTDSDVWLRRLDQLDATRIAGVAGINAVFSPDGSELAIATVDGKLMRATLAGTAPRTLSDSAWYVGSWSDDGYIYYTNLRLGVSRIPADGGTPETLTEISGASAYEVHAIPITLPSGKGVVFTSVGSLGSTAQSEIRVLDLGTRQVKPLVQGFMPAYADGRLVFATSGGTLVHVPFDEDRLEITGTPEVITTGLATFFGLANVHISRTGTLLYQLGPSSGGDGSLLSIVNRSGVATSLPLPRAPYNSLRLSPDGTRLALEVTAGASDGGDIYVLTMGDSVSVRLSRQGINTYPVWSRDGRHVAYSRLLDGERDLAWQPADGSGRAETLLRRPGDQFELEFAPDGHLIVREGNATGSVAALDIVSVAPGGGSAQPFAADPKAAERAHRLSPDGRWLAYVSDENGREEVFVRPYPDAGTGAQWQVSDNGGTEPVWAHSGRELFYKSQNVLFSAEVRTTPGFALGARRRLFSVTGYVNNLFHARYDVLPGDTSFVMFGLGTAEQGVRTVMVEGWLEELRRKRSQ
jgi:serine/threonine-protein kinase